MTETPRFETLLGYAPAPAALKGRVIVVTGAAAGIGRAVADAVARLGATVIALDSNGRELEDLRESLAACSAPAPQLEVIDFATATTTDYQQLAARIGKQYGRLDGLLNNAGRIGALSPFEHVEPQVFGQVMAINLVAPFFLTQWCMPLLRKAEDPVLVFSLHHTEQAFWGAYGVAKAGLKGLLHIIADEYHLDGNSPVRVLGIDPGPVATAERRRHYPGEPVDMHPAPGEVIGPYLYALGPDSRGMTNIVLK